VAREIVVSFQGTESSFAFKSMDRSALYGRRRRVALDADGTPCARASLLDDGSLLLRSGMTGQGYFLPDGQFLKQSDLEAFDAAGTPLDKVPSTIGVAQELHGPVSPTEVLDMRLESIYALESDGMDPALKNELDSGSIFRFDFNFREDYRAETAFLVANDNGAFALVGVPVTHEWSSFDLAVELPADETDSDDDDLDFDF